MAEGICGASDRINTARMSGSRDHPGRRRAAPRVSFVCSYYHRSRLHLSLDRDAQDQRPVQSVGNIVAISEVGGLHHRYERHAA